MYRTYHLTEAEQDKITVIRWDGDTHYYDVYENEEERKAEQERLTKIEEEYRRAKEAYLATL